MDQTMTDPSYLRRAEAARYLQDRCGAFTTQTLAGYACRGGGPKFRMLGRFPVYSTADLDAWLQGRTSAPVTRNVELAQ
jgi:hypothetical protein